jgi:hypothetical protein
MEDNTRFVPKAANEEQFGILRYARTQPVVIAQVSQKMDNGSRHEGPVRIVSAHLHESRPLEPLGDESAG